jgi:nitroreductase/NAD-dependent dihydropyrimidine dehydrogenase PreA subunit
MEAVSIDRNKCNTCSVCVEVSPMCFAKNGDGIKVLADDKTCVVCGHCVGACPTGAIEHRLMDMANFPEVSKESLLETDTLIRFVRERRAHRAFSKRLVPRHDLEKLIDTVRYAPTGHNDQSVEIIMVENPERRRQLSNLAVDFAAADMKADVEKLKDLRASGKGSPEQIAQLEGMVGFRQMLVQMRDAGLDPVFYAAPAVAIFHSTTKTVTAKDNGVIAATTMGLLARTMGLETTYIYVFEHAANVYEPLRKALALPDDNVVVAVLVIGYPKIKYQRAVDRKAMRVRWE